MAKKLSPEKEGVTMRRIRFYTPEMGQVGMTRWFADDEQLPGSLDWSKVTGIEISETMTVDDFRAKYPEIKLDQR